jgi:hypothetical protein
MIDMNELNDLILLNSCVLKFAIEIEEHTLKYNLTLTLAMSEVANVKKITLYFRDISNLSVSEFGGGLTQFMHLEVFPQNSGFDRAKYLLKDSEDNRVSFYFSTVDQIE